MKYFRGFFLFVLFGTAGTLVRAQSKNADVAGTWNLSVQTSAGSGSPTFVFKKDTDSSFSGTYTGQLGEAPVTGKVKGQVVHFEFSVQGNLVTYDGTVDGDSMKGNLKLGTMAEGTFTGNRKKD